MYVCVKSKGALSTPFLSGGSRGSKSQHWQGGCRGSVDLAGIKIQAMMGSEHRARRGRDCHQGRVCTEVGVRQGEAWEDVSFVVRQEVRKNPGEQMGAALEEAPLIKAWVVTSAHPLIFASASLP